MDKNFKQSLMIFILYKISREKVKVDFNEQFI